MISINNGAVWRMFPCHGNGIATISTHPTDAYFLLQRGFLTIDGKRASVQHAVCTEDDGSVMLRIMLDDWETPHPSRHTPVTDVP